MDTSETYIKMCEKAEEIQAIADEHWDEFSMSCWHSPNHVQCKGHFSDWHMAYKYCPVCGKALKITPEYSFCHRFLDDDTTWLPRQDQLQEMVIGKVEMWTTAITGLHNLAKFAETIEFGSMEQLWLAFVMKEKYSKVWNGDEWVSTSTSL